MGTNAPGPRRDQPAVIRLTHWLNLPLMVVLAGSGLQILVAYPFLGPRGAPYAWWPLQGWTPPDWLRLGDWLAGARALHFGAMWLWLLNAAIYATYLFVSGEWRRRLFTPARDARGAWGTALHYARLRREAPPQGFYNGLQRLGYTSALGLGLVLTLSGLAIWKPVQLQALATLLGGYDGARAVHLLALAAALLFVLGHVLMVTLHPRTFPPMLTGGPRRAPTAADEA
jgi:thiosulfate reductase cytochrome b subunit